MRILLSTAFMACLLAACGAPTSESIRPRADEGACPRIDGQTRCSDSLSSARTPAEKAPF